MAEHYLKLHSNYFDAVASGLKNFEVRWDDRGFQKGDVLILQKYDIKTQKYALDGYGIDAKVIEVRRRITYVLTGGKFGIEPGYVVLGLVEDG